jgi:hypothetical protein
MVVIVDSSFRWQLCPSFRGTSSDPSLSAGYSVIIFHSPLYFSFMNLPQFVIIYCLWICR